MAAIRGCKTLRFARYTPPCRLSRDGTERGRSSGVEHNLAKVGVVSSNLIARSNFSQADAQKRSFPFGENGGPFGEKPGLQNAMDAGAWCKRASASGLCNDFRDFRWNVDFDGNLVGGFFDFVQLFWVRE